jgi:hypothetical protein
MPSDRYSYLLRLRPDLEPRLRAGAKAADRTINDYLTDLIAEHTPVVDTEPARAAAQ